MKGRFKRIDLIVCFLLLICLVSTGCVQSVSANDQYQAADLNDFKDNTVFMHVGSPLILSGDDIAFLDPEDFDVAAIIHKERTLVPMRAVAEYFGADVSYDSKKREANISCNGEQFVFPIGKTYFLETGSAGTKTVEMDTEALIVRNRTMVPIRVIAEQLLKKNVGYNDGVIMISGESKAPDLNKDKILLNTIKSKIGLATKARSKEQLSKLLQGNAGHYRSGFGGFDLQADGLVENPASIIYKSADAVSNESMATQDNSAAADEGFEKHSDTNTQVEGIDEADIVKTDGKYIYYAGSNAVRIIRADGSRLSEVYVIKLSDQKYVQEIYVDGDRLVLLGNRNENDNDRYYPMAEESDRAESMPEGRMIYPGYTRAFAFADIYNIENREKPVLLKSHEMEGHYQSSRKSGDNLYLVTNTNWYGGIILPLMRDTARQEEVMQIDISDVMVMPEPPGQGYIVLSAINIKDSSRTEIEAITAFGSTVYMNESSMYLAAENYNGMTEITKFRIDGTNIGYAGSGKVKGSLLNQFSMDEFEGNLRVATTEWDKGNNLFVLNDSLTEIGSVTGLAKGERIYSVRFMGDKGYVVTFRNIDPLFVFDLSEPTAPKVTGELKIPGFSNYLHPVGDGLILGIGMETRELFERDASGREEAVGFRQGGLKVSLFDVSDMGKPKEIDKLIIGENGSYSEALNNHKAVMVDSDSNLIAFDSFIVRDKDWKQSKQGALVIDYSGRKISEKGFLEYTEPEVYGKYIPYGRRTVYIGNTLYYVQDGIISAFDYGTLEKIGSIELR